MDIDPHLGPDDGKPPKPPYTTIHQALLALKPKLQAINPACENCLTTQQSA